MADGGRIEVIEAAVLHLREAERSSGRVELEKLGFFAPSLVSPERLVSAASIEARVEADRADACLAADDFVAMDGELLRAKERLDCSLSESASLQGVR